MSITDDELWAAIGRGARRRGFCVYIEHDKRRDPILRTPPAKAWRFSHLQAHRRQMARREREGYSE